MSVCQENRIQGFYVFLVRAVPVFDMYKNQLNLCRDLARCSKVQIERMLGGRDAQCACPRGYAVRLWGITLYATDGLHTLYFMNEQSAGVWAFYSITRVLPNTFLGAGHDKSYINRAIALYRHIVGLPTDAEPPAAR